MLSEDIIRAAVAGEKWAMEKVVEQYSDLIDKYAIEKIVMPDGNIKEVINEDKKQTLILALLEAVKKFPLL